MVSKHLPSSLLALGFAVIVAGPAAAQDTTQAGPRPERHVVQLGETLWGLAQLYMGDPFLWPEIYRLNTTVVEDPHWIFPGEELWLVAADRTQVAVEAPVAAPPAAQAAVLPPTDTLVAQQEAVQRPVEAVELPAALPAAPPPGAETGPTIFARTVGAQQNQPIQFGPADRYWGVQPGDFYRAGFLTEEEQLPWGTVEGIADIGTARGSLQGVDAAMAMIYAEIRLRAPEGAMYQVGDSLLVAEVGRPVSGGWGNIVAPMGIVRVTNVNGPDAVATVIQQYGPIRAGQGTLPLEPYPRLAPGRPQPVTGGIEGLVVARRDLNPVPNQYEVLFIDLGRNVGISAGDLFELLTTPELTERSPAGPQVLAEIEIVHVRERSATAVINRILTPGIRLAARNAQGVPVRLVAKMPA
jgi:hypothetical protein